MTSDGRFIAFLSRADNLIPSPPRDDGDPDGIPDDGDGTPDLANDSFLGNDEQGLYLRDMQSGKTTLITRLDSPDQVTSDGNVPITDLFHAGEAEVPEVTWDPNTQEVDIVFRST
jgi:hypothetical protein